MLYLIYLYLYTGQKTQTNQETNGDQTFLLQIVDKITKHTQNILNACTTDTSTNTSRENKTMFELMSRAEYSSVSRANKFYSTTNCSDSFIVIYLLADLHIFVFFLVISGLRFLVVGPRRLATDFLCFLFDWNVHKLPFTKICEPDQLHLRLESIAKTTVNGVLMHNSMDFCCIDHRVRNRLGWDRARIDRTKNTHTQTEK